MGDDLIKLRGVLVPLDGDVGHQFVSDAVRATEGLIEDRELIAKWELSPTDFKNLTKNLAVGRAMRAERDRRIRQNIAAQEAAAKEYSTAPQVLGKLLHNEFTPARARIDAARELRASAVNNNANQPADTSKFIIRFDLTAGGGDVETYEKSLNSDPTNGDTPPDQFLLPLEGKPNVEE